MAFILLKQSKIIDNVYQLLWLIQPPLMFVGLRDGYGIHQWDLTMEQFMMGLKVGNAADCLPHTLMKTASPSLSRHVRTDDRFDKDFTPSAIPANIRSYAHPPETILFCSMPYHVQHIILHRGRICGDVPMHAPREDLEPKFARTLHQQICHPLKICCGKRYYRYIHRGVAPKGYMGITNAEKKEVFR